LSIKKSARAAICLYHQRYPNRAVPYHKKIDSETNLRIYGVFKKPKQQYPVPRDENVELDVILSIEENPDTSIRQMASEQGTSYGTVQRILKKQSETVHSTKSSCHRRRRSSQKS
jgi:hypothetical protein